MHQPRFSFPSADTADRLIALISAVGLFLLFLLPAVVTP